VVWTRRWFLVDRSRSSRNMLGGSRRRRGEEVIRREQRSNFAVCAAVKHRDVRGRPARSYSRPRDDNSLGRGSDAESMPESSNSPGYHRLSARPVHGPISLSSSQLQRQPSVRNRQLSMPTSLQFDNSLSVTHQFLTG